MNNSHFKNKQQVQKVQGVRSLKIEYFIIILFIILN